MNYVKQFLPNMDVGVESGTYSHLQVLCNQHGIIDLEPKLVKNKTERHQLLKLFSNNDIKHMITSGMQFVELLDPIIVDLERQIIKQAHYHNHHDCLLLMTISGIGEMLGLVILYETHDITRFASVQRYSSYCGVVKCEHSSSGEIINAKNTKIRNAYLKRAFGEAIIKAQVDPKIAKLYDHLKSKYGLGSAKSVIGHRFAVAA